MNNSSIAFPSDSSLAELDLFDCLFLLVVLEVNQIKISILKSQLLVLMQQLNKHEIVGRRSMPTVPKRRSFEEIANLIPSYHFRRIFRMNRVSFDKLCSILKSKVGEPVFKSQEWLDSHAEHYQTYAARQAMGGLLSGEIKLAMTLRMLAGASYLDIMCTYGTSPATLYVAFHETIGWICDVKQFPLSNWIMTKDKISLEKVSEGFAEASGGIFKKCIGALDGVAVKIKGPTASNMITDPGNYFCRKGFHALNVQAICDKHRRVLWVSTGHKGSTHDSNAFVETKLSKVLEDASDWLEDNGFFLIGDSAYPLLPYFLVPFPDPQPNSPEDAFNYWLSNSRIQIECTFGELVMRWGIFWKKLSFNINQVGNIVTAAMVVHNFLIDERDADETFKEQENAYFETFSPQNQEECILTRNPAPLALVTDNDESRPRGRPSKQQAKGKAKRDGITGELYASERGRRMDSNMSYNSYGQVYFTS